MLLLRHRFIGCYCSQALMSLVAISKCSEWSRSCHYYQSTGALPVERLYCIHVCLLRNCVCEYFWAPVSALHWSIVSWSMTSAVSQLNFEFKLPVLMIVVQCILIKKALAHVELTVNLNFNPTHLELWYTGGLTCLLHVLFFFLQ